MAQRPPRPPLPANLDLSNLDYMPVVHRRLMRSKSWLRAKERPELGFYMLNLWIKAWNEKPAASLENDDLVLRDAAMCRPEIWGEIRDDCLAGFKLHSDGRLYHGVLVEQALIALEKRMKWRQKKKTQRAISPGKAPDIPRGVPGEHGGNPPKNAVTGRDGTGRDGTLVSDAKASDSLPAFDLGPDDCEVARSEWNAMAKDMELPAASKLDAGRKRKLKARLKELDGLPGWRAMLGKIRASQYLSGQKNDWRVSFTWVLEPGNLVKIMEGNYDDRPSSNGHSNGNGHRLAVVSDIAAAVAGPGVLSGGNQEPKPAAAEPERTLDLERTAGGFALRP